MAFQGRRDERLPVQRPWKAIVRFAATAISPLAVIASAGVMIKAQFSGMVQKWPFQVTI